MVLKYFQNIVLGTKLLLYDRLSSFSNVIKKIVVFLVYVCVIAWLAVFFYGTFYFYYVPVVSQVKPLHFQFSVFDDETRHSFPACNVSLVNDNENQVFMWGQVYKIVVEMDLPESPVNRDIGMFMLELRLYNMTGETVQMSSRAVTQQYRSELLRVIETFVFAPFLVFGYMTQKQTINVELFSNYMDYSFNPAVGAFVEVKSRQVQIYSAWLKIFAEFTGVRYFLYYWPVTSAVVGVFWNFIVLSFIALMSWHKWSTSNNGRDTKETPKDRSKKNPWKQKRDRVNPETVGHEHPLHGQEETTLLTSVKPKVNTGLRLRQPQPQ